MAEDSKKAGNFSLSSTGMLALVFAVFGLIWSGPSALIAERPGSKTAPNSHKGRIQDIDARMWQDPLGAIQKYARKPASIQRSLLLKQTGTHELKLVVEDESIGKNDHSPELTIQKVFEDGNNKKGKTRFLMLGVMLPGGPYPEDEEGRRRTRYAVLSALDTLDFSPKETELIGYFRTSTSKDLGYSDVPFEVFGKKQNIEDNAVQKLKVIVLWLDDSYLGKNIRASIKEIFTQAQPEHDKPDIKRVVIGPNKSAHLRRLIREIPKDETDGTNEEIEFFSAGATAAPARIENGATNSNKDKYYPRVDLWRTIGNDGDISKALVQELGLRQINPEHDHVLLISEWDTVYGRSFPQTFIEAYRGKTSDVSQTANTQQECAPLSYAMNSINKVYCVNYMSGIDGLLPDDSGKTETSGTAQNKSDAIQVNNNIDRPSGNNQKDYLRRLVDQVRKLDADIRNSKIPCPVRNNGISAIGVVGSDVFDKLMILQALRPYFPGKIFFTTDLDAAYFSPQEQPFTHNLIVGSSFGLTLAPELQRAIPPFRDSYQTAIFFSTKLATTKWSSSKNDATENIGESDLKDKISQWLAAPRIFEIGRKGPVDLSNQSNTREICDLENFALCNRIHPDSDIDSDRDRPVSVKFLMLSSLILGLLLLYRVSWTFRWLPSGIKSWIARLHDHSPADNKGQKIDAPLTTRQKAPKAWLGGTLAMISMLPLVLAGLFIVITIYLFITNLGADEPFYWGNGVSIWPSNLLNLLALLLSIGFFFKIRHQLEECDKELETAFCLNSGKRLRNLRAMAVDSWEHRRKEDTRINVVELWADYLAFGMRPARFRRTALNTFIFVLFGLTAIMLSGGLPIPSRGGSFYIDVLIEFACVVAVVFLIMWVVDAARLFSKFIHLLAEDKVSDWPNICAGKWGWPTQYADSSAYWVDIQFVAQYTKSMGKFIWYPIPPLLLIGAARSQVFDNWTFSSGLLVSIAILLLYLFSIAFLMQYGAKEMRTKAVTTLTGKVRELRSQPETDEKKIEQIEKMISEIKNNEEGAFTPFLRQPMVQALLAFLSGSGGLVLLLDRFF